MNDLKSITWEDVRKLHGIDRYNALLQRRLWLERQRKQDKKEYDLMRFKILRLKHKRKKCLQN